jgi:hypothetical protein
MNVSGGGNVNVGAMTNNGSLSISAGGIVSSTLTLVGGNASSSGGATLSGAGATWNTTSLSIGGNNSAAGGVGVVTINPNATANVGGNLTVWGTSGTSLTVAGGTLNVTGTTTLAAGGVMNVTGGTVNAPQLIDNGSLTINSGVQLSHTSALVGSIASSNGVATISGAGTRWSPSSLYIGGNDIAAGGVGVVNINANATANIAGLLTVWGNSGTAVNVNGGTLNVTGPSTIATGGTLAVTGGTVNAAAMTNDGTIVHGAGSTSVADLNQSAPHLGNITISAGGTLTADHVHQNNLTVNAGSLVIRHGATPDVASRLRSLSLGATGKLNLNNNALIVTQTQAGTWTGSAYDGITGLIAAGRNGGAWNGARGIVTSESDATSGNYITLAVASAADARHISGTEIATWEGETVSASDTLVMYTYGGDATLDGKVNIDDYVRIDSGIVAEITGYANGDFNLDGKINIDDYTQFIDVNVNVQGPPFPQGSGIDLASLASASSGVNVASMGVSSGATLGGGVSAVPEPGVLIAPLAGALFLRRRRNGGRGTEHS